MTARRVVPDWKAGMRRGQKSGPNDKEWDPPFTYRCTSGHDIASDKAWAKCPAYVLGDPCTGTLHRVGAGSGRGSNLLAATG